MTRQEFIDRDLRMLIGELQIQLIFLRSQVAELEEQLARQPKPDNDAEATRNVP